MRWGPLSHFWRARLLSTVRTDTFREFFAWRRQQSRIKNSTLHKDVVLVRQILKHAVEQGLLTQLPRIPSVGTMTKNPRPWLTPSGWLHLNQVAGENAEFPTQRHAAGLAGSVRRRQGLRAGCA